MAQIRRYLLVGCKGLRDRNVDDALQALQRRASCRLKDWTFPRTPESGGAGCAWARGDVWNYLRGQHKEGCEMQ